MNIFTQLVYAIGRLTPDYVQMLGTGFLVSNHGHIVTTHHVTGSCDNNLVFLEPHIGNINNYQDTSVKEGNIHPINIAEIDPIKDICLLKAAVLPEFVIPPLGTFDSDNIGDEVGIFGFPHCTEGRRVLTFQKAEIGAKVLVEIHGVKAKHAVINTQARPGQSGSIVFSPGRGTISGMLVGAWGGAARGVISLGGINPRELHQTTHCISAEYIKEMI